MLPLIKPPPSGRGGTGSVVPAPSTAPSGAMDLCMPVVSMAVRPRPPRGASAGQTSAVDPAGASEASGGIARRKGLVRRSTVSKASTMLSDPGSGGVTESPSGAKVAVGAVATSLTPSPVLAVVKPTVTLPTSTNPAPFGGKAVMLKKAGSRGVAQGPQSSPQVKTVAVSSPSAPSPARFRFAVLSGNNSRLILQCFRHRRGWFPVPLRSSAAPDGDAPSSSHSASRGPAPPALLPCHFIWEMYRNKVRFDPGGGGLGAPTLSAMVNHMPFNACLSSKCGLFRSLAASGLANDDAEVADEGGPFIPATYILTRGVYDEAAAAFRAHYGRVAQELSSESAASSGDSDKEDGIAAAPLSDKPVLKPPRADVTKLQQKAQQCKNVWIMKPGQYANRGSGISVVQSVEEVFAALDICTPPGSDRHGTAAPTLKGTCAAGGCEDKDDASESDEDNENDCDDGDEGKPVAAGTSKDKSDKKATPATPKGRSSEWIVQRYLERPLLLHGRKFDIRMYVLVTARNGGASLEGYVYQDYYIRTSSKKYSLTDLSDKVIHLTNDAIQKKTALYGKFESGNKLDMDQFAACLEGRCAGDASGAATRDRIFARITDIVRHSLAATAPAINRKRRPLCFELFGYDFMVDEDFNVWFIEVNSNPCLELSCPYLGRIIPRLLEHAFRLTVDVDFPSSAAVTSASDASTPMGGTATTPPPSASTGGVAAAAASGGSGSGSIPTHEDVGAACGENRFQLVFTYDYPPPPAPKPKG